jgi:hypothetical protein
MAGSYKEEVTGGRVIGHVPSKLEPNQTHENLTSQSINMPADKKSKKTRKIGITIDTSNNNKKNFYREVTGGSVVGHVPSKLEPSKNNSKAIEPISQLSYS